MSGFLGLAIDPARAGSDPATVAATGAHGVWYVARPQYPPTPYQRAGLRTSLVLARESGDLTQYARWHPDAFVIGNEPDISSSSSWTMTVGQYGGLVLAILGMLKGVPLLSAGLASGQDWLPVSITALLGGITLHPYGEGVGIRAFLDRYRHHNLPIHITEWWPNEDATRLALTDPDVASVYWWWHDPVGDGALGIKDNPDRLAAFARLAREFNGGDMPDQEYVVGPGVKDAMARNGDEPLGSEEYPIPSYSFTPGKKGLYIYSKDANQTYVSGKA